MKNMGEMMKGSLGTYGLVAAAYILVELFLKAGMVSSLLQGLLVPVCVYIVLAVSLNLVVGISGELSLGHAGFMCVGAFAGAFFSNCVKDAIPVGGLRIFLALCVGAAVAAFFGLLIGIPVLRLRGDYLAIVTLAFGEIIKNVVNVFYVGLDGGGLHLSAKDKMSLGMEADGVVIINGPQGITGTPKDATFTAGILLVLVALFIVLNLIHSRDGRAIRAIRDNRIAAESIGIPVTKYKLMAFAASASLAGAAGVLYAHNLASLQASKFSFNTSILVLVFVVLGGIGNIRGSVIAAVILTLLPELLRALNDYRMLIYAVVLIAMMLFTSSPAGMALQERYSIRRLFGRTDETKEEA